MPFTIADATCLTQAGYVGEDVESILYRLYQEAGQDIEATQVALTPTLARALAPAPTRTRTLTLTLTLALIPTLTMP